MYTELPLIIILSAWKMIIKILSYFFTYKSQPLPFIMFCYNNSLLQKGDGVYVPPLVVLSNMTLHATTPRNPNKVTLAK